MADTTKSDQRPVFALVTISILFFLFFIWGMDTERGRLLDLTFTRFLNGLNLAPFEGGLAVFTVMGSAELTFSACLLLSFWFYHVREFRKAYLCLAAVLILTGMEYMMKQTVNHPPPPHEFLKQFPIHFGGTSIRTAGAFPSGHTLRVTFLVTILYSWLGRSKRQFWVFVCAAGTVFLSGFSVVYFGWHWASDVIGGCWLAGFAVFILNRTLLKQC